MLTVQGQGQAKKGVGAETREQRAKPKRVLTQEDDQVSLVNAARGRALRACSRAKPMLAECRSWRREAGDDEEEEEEEAVAAEQEEEGIGLSTMMEAGRLRDCIFRAMTEV